MASKTVCTMTADIPGEPSAEFYGETVTISFEGGYLLEEKADQTHLINAAKAFALELYGEHVYVNLFDEQGKEIWRIGPHCHCSDDASKGETGY